MKNEKSNSSVCDGRIIEISESRHSTVELHDHRRIPVHGNRKTRRSKEYFISRIAFYSRYLLDPLHTRKTLQECKGIALFPWKIYKSVIYNPRHRSFDPIYIYICMYICMYVYISTPYNSTKMKKKKKRNVIRKSWN